MNWKKRSKKYDAILIMVGVAYLKMTEAQDKNVKESYQELMDYLLKEIKEISEE